MFFKLVDILKRSQILRPFSIAISTLFISSVAYGDDLERIEVKSSRYSWLKDAKTASEGEVSHEKFEERPLLRPGELMEAVPGLVATQHSGTGKANQYFLRGFNLDHGTDFATYVDGIPINMPTHAHGQGYTDVNFLIPEIVDRLNYSKGPYSASAGNFTGAGHVEVKTFDVFPQGLAKYTGGSYGYHRILGLDSIAISDKQYLSYAFEGTQYKGPWTSVDEDLQKRLGWLKYVRETAEGKHVLQVQHYDGKWNATDQIPSRAVKKGSLSRLGTIDPTSGGKTRRGSVSWIYEKNLANGLFSTQVYGVDYALNLWSNFGFYLDDPINGDQFEQEDRRSVFGGSVNFSQDWNIASVLSRFRIGLQNRSDNIKKVGLYKTTERQRVSSTAESSVQEYHNGIFLEQEMFWNENFKTIFGVRYDQIQFKNRDALNQEARDTSASLASPKFSARYGLIPNLNLFLSAGQSFHSNDARGVTAKESSAPGLVPVRGYEIGSSYLVSDQIHISLALWRLQLDSELIYIGDAGTTEPSRGSRREGLDWLLQVAPSETFHADFELSWSKARFTSDPDGEGDQVEGHVPLVATIDIGSQLNKEWSFGGRMKHFAGRPLTADGQHKSDPTTVLGLHAGYEIENWQWMVDALNVLDSKDHDIDYYYESRLPDEPEAVADTHYHPVEPRSLRVSVARKF